MSKISAGAVRSEAAAGYRHFTDKVDEFKKEQKDAQKKAKDQGLGRFIGGAGGLLAMIVLNATTGGAISSLSLLGRMAVAGASAGIGSAAGQSVAVGGKKGNVSIGKFYQEQGRQANKNRQKSISANAINDAATAAKSVYAFSKFNDFVASIDKGKTVLEGASLVEDAKDIPINTTGIVDTSTQIGRPLSGIGPTTGRVARDVGFGKDAAGNMLTPVQPTGSVGPSQLDPRDMMANYANTLAKPEQQFDYNKMLSGGF